MTFKRGDKAICKATGKIVIILGPEDFEQYEYNRPRHGGIWELVEYPDGFRVWSPALYLETVEEVRATAAAHDVTGMSPAENVDLDELLLEAITLYSDGTSSFRRYIIE